MLASNIPQRSEDARHNLPQIRLLAYRSLLIVFSQVCLTAATYYCAFLLANDCSLSPAASHLFAVTLPAVLLIKLPVFYRFGLMSGWWRYVGMSDLLDITMASICSSGLLYVLLHLLALQGYRPAVLIIDFVLTIVLIGGARFVVRAYTEFALRGRSSQKNTLIVGAGSAGSSVVRQLQKNPDLGYRPIGFVDDNPTKKGVRIHGVKVLGTTTTLKKLLAQYSIECVLIAAPSAKGELVEKVVAKCRASDVEFKILPPLSEMINGSGYFRQVRNVSVEDLLGRKPVQLDLENIRGQLQNKTALITGAAGSIGSELARQIARFRPSRLILFERSENDLFKLSNELSAKFPEIQHVPVVGDILDVGVLRDVFSRFHPGSVFHAAAYKHVPMMEDHCFQAVTNNVFGTYNVALVSTQYDVENFVMISSDKAVNPTNIMGVTKRIAELIILGLQNRQTRFMAVRFGNVLGSNGSVLPTFQQQIANGGPVTVTHPQAKRFFMTIPEAVQLVLQASSMGLGGEIFVLNMGEPVRIVDLAQTLIRLSGMVPGKDIKIVFTGLRPGEKLYEELMFEGEGLKHTRHNEIRVLDCGTVNFMQVRGWLDELSALVESRNVSGLVRCIMSIVPEYTPSPEILSRCEVDRHDQALRYMRDRATLGSRAFADVRAQDVA
jgi:FlaA1/EpsC-like NDP-sugar epimerase